MNNQFVTNKYKRDIKTKALLANDIRALRKHQKQKEMAETIKNQSSYINNLEGRVEILEELVSQITNNKKLLKLESLEN